MLLPPKTAFVLFYLLYLIRAVLATVIGAWSSRSHAGRQVSPDGKGQLALSRHLAVHLGHRLTEPHASPPLHQLTGELQHVAGHHLPFEACILSWQLEKVSLFFINEVEGSQMTQKSEPKDILDQMLFQYPDAAVVLTLGEKGAWYADREERYFCPAQKVQAVDTTAAGDTFTGYFLMAQEKGFSAEQCLSIAAQASAIAVSRKGASVSVPVWAELQMDL